MEKVKLICFPHAGAGKTYYSKWKKEFNKDMEFHIIQYPLRENKSNISMPESIQDLVEDIFKEYKGLFEGNYFFWGHSMGSLVAYETIKLCQKYLSKEPVAFFSSGASAPCCKNFMQGEDFSSNAGIIKFLKKHGGINSELLNYDGFMDYYLSIIKADMKILSAYKDYEFEKINCPLILLVGIDDICNIEKWPYYTEGEIQIHKYSGGHFFIEDHKQEIISLMEKYILDYIYQFK